MKSFKLVLLLLLVPVISHAQGKIMLVGGGTELNTDWSWSNTPYKWAIDQSDNKKVAIISYSLGGDPAWLPDYFIGLGATEAANFEINTADSANSPLTYDALMSYDVLFFKGGDQSNYYTTYKGSKVTEAITDKYNEGGVISGTSAGMAILSGVMYTAENNTVYPDEVLENIYDGGITLKNDFVSILDDYVADTHFAERGRFPRLLAFIGNWYLTEGSLISGIGMDDRTAFCINEMNIGTAYGTGAVSIYSTNSFSADAARPIADSVHATYLTHGMSYDLTAREMTSDYIMGISPTINQENGNYTLYLSGSAPLSHNEALLNDFLSGVSSDIVIVSSGNSSLYQHYASHLQSNSNFEVTLVKPVVSNDTCQNVTERNAIRSSSAFLFVDNDPEVLFDFLENDVTGKLLSEHIAKDENIIAFMGEDAKLAGAVHVTNNQEDPLNAYYGELAYDDGLELLKTSIIMPDTYDPSSADYYENNAASVKYAMVTKRLRYGFYLNERSFIKFYQEGGQNYVDSHGPYSSILLTNNGTYGSVASQQVNSSGNVRNIVGFDQMKFSLISNSPVKVGFPGNSETPEVNYELEAPAELTAAVSNGEVLLTWSNINEGSVEFNIERSTDGLSYSLIGTTNDVAFTDDLYELGNAYDYKVAAFKGNTYSCYSNIAKVNAITGVEPTDGNGPQFSPNPARGYITLQGITSGLTSEIVICDAQGKIVGTVSASETATINLRHLKPGTYHLKILNGKQILNRKIILLSE
ncbi:hypothetical protein GCM10009122_31640 [Fulvivirga kasyanovii]|uniref:T9SS type A sorting domain-containing protein n=1 Tax=Fulvivirga kasyanovii TaxID=396812 RepID=A0ABW9RXC7_9BACT|nr:T9SS type A sorting domain-containing protein [Fulvivirga kasyanovii]MTI27858.1 T9SS type A sorting domain-containing protein [Fulvivirga kasyanovii]